MHPIILSLCMPGGGSPLQRYVWANVTLRYVFEPFLVQPLPTYLRWCTRGRKKGPTCVPKALQNMYCKFIGTPGLAATTTTKRGAESVIYWDGHNSVKEKVI